MAKIDVSISLFIPETTSTSFLKRDCMVMGEVDQRKTARFPCLEKESFAREKRNSRIPSDGKMLYRGEQEESYVYQSWHIGHLLL